MTFVKRPFPISSHKAAILKRSNRLGVSGWDISDGDYAPFTPVWPSRRVFSEKTRFTLPALAFKGQIVAQLGYRNKDGFMFVREGLGQHAELALARRFQQMAEDASRHDARHKHNAQEAMTRAKQLIAGSPLLPLVRGDERYDGFRASLRGVPQALLVHAVVGELRKNPDVHFSLSETEERGSLEIVLRGDGAFSHLVGSYSWHMQDNSNYACTVSAQAPLTSADMIRFAGACVENHLRGIEAEKEIDVSQLEDDIRGTDFGY